MKKIGIILACVIIAITAVLVPSVVQGDNNVTAEATDSVVVVMATKSTEATTEAKKQESKTTTKSSKSTKKNTNFYYAYIIDESVVVHEKPKASSKTVCRLSFGTKVKVYKTKNKSWRKIGKNKWVYKSRISKKKHKKYYTKQDVIDVAKVLQHESINIPNKVEQACVAWVILNRVDAGYGNIYNVIRAPGQFFNVDNYNKQTDKAIKLSKDVLNRWNKEKNGQKKVGRVLPKQYMWYNGDGSHNYFRSACNKPYTIWDYSLPNPYKKKGKYYQGVKLQYSKKYNVCSNPLTRPMGVKNYKGHRETWYSQKVLPGPGLKIPGRHVANDGTIRDKNGYICVAASPSYKSYGSRVMTSLGPGKVYDSGCAYGTIDIYVNW